MSHSWSKNGVYTIKAKAKDMRDAESEWSNPLILALTEKTIIIGFISNKTLNGDLTFFKAKQLIYICLKPFVIDFYSSKENIVISKKYNGWLGNKYITGIFEAVVI